MTLTTQLSQLLDTVVRPGWPGVAVGVYSDGKLLEHAEAGLACVEFDVPVAATTRFDIASMSKHFAATAVLLLCRDGQLSLDDDIRTYLPELKLTSKVTVGQCLRHTGGVPDYLALSRLAGRTMTRITQNQVLAFIAELTEINFEPETDISYSNSGYVLIASLIHRISGKSLREFAAERIFGPLGMAETFFRDDSREVLRDFAYGYEVTDHGVRRADSEESLVGDGALVTSIADLGPWFGFLQDGRVLGVEIRDGLLAQVGPTGSKPREYAHGLIHSVIGGEAVFGHAGGVQGYKSQLFFMPSRNLGVALLTNNSSVDPERIGIELLLLATGLSADEPKEFLDGSNAAAGVVGYWQDVGADAFVRVEAENGRIRLSNGHMGGEFVLAADGTWYGQGNGASLRLSRSGESFTLGILSSPWRDRSYRRCEPPLANTSLAPAVYRSPELGTLITVAGNDMAEIGLDLVASVEPGPAGTFSAAGIVLRPDGDDLLVSSNGAGRLRYQRQSDDTVPVGVPAGLNLSD
ncbi:serine hydrolase domain-containing protein [Arthrobacter sp. B2a2-09]|uniref:serine hydrolase domain-containing protein n=1 Tax=Arthrobacter sp. B2a2-09 TaxID=2952822 RepID=UPI0022CD26F2|nr:serine hydrolase domain-containing protein [Arthrobacter sp. B2a2-09]MCZ9880464.1 serine hydrolase [Arthrobacter sp. B2a2-09]